MDLSKVPAIEPFRQYRPQEIVKAGWIVNNFNRPNYKYILRLINKDILKHHEGSFATNKYFLVMGKDIIDYRKKTYGVDTPIQESNRPQENILPESI